MFAAVSVQAAMILVMYNAYHYQTTPTSQKQFVLLKCVRLTANDIESQRLFIAGR